MITSSIVTNQNQQHIELGKVRWLRDYNTALEKSRVEHKPVLLFFQEIPGCSTCVNFGRDVLSDPLMVEFIENEFIPLAIYNNLLGRDNEILKMYNEAAWNNPVAHFIDENGQDIISKLSNNYQPLAMYNKLVETLQTLGKPLPNYAKLLKDDLKLQYSQPGVTIFETPCFWSGETIMAQHPAVLYTEAGWIGASEVVKVYFDTTRANETELINYAQAKGFYQIDNHNKYKVDKNPQYYLGKSAFAKLNLSKAQRMKINAAIAFKMQPEQYLSPKQYKLYMDLVNNKQNY